MNRSLPDDWSYDRVMLQLLGTTGTVRRMLRLTKVNHRGKNEAIVKLHVLLLCRAADRIVGAQGNYKKWGPYHRLCEGGLGAGPKKFGLSQRLHRGCVR